MGVREKLSKRMKEREREGIENHKERRGELRARGEQGGLVRRERKIKRGSRRGGGRMIGLEREEAGECERENVEEGEA